jgi:aldehyde dehydrogenase (NAD+)
MMVEIDPILKKLGIEPVNHGASTGQNSWAGAGETLESSSPVDGGKIAAVTQCTRSDYDRVIENAAMAFKTWRNVPAPKRGEIVRQMGEQLRNYKQELGMLVSYEMGKSLQEGLGEVQEMIDICDFATGLSRQLYGLTMHSERPQHRMSVGNCGHYHGIQLSRRGMVVECDDCVGMRGCVRMETLGKDAIDGNSLSEYH